MYVLKLLYGFIVSTMLLVVLIPLSVLIGIITTFVFMWQSVETCVATFEKIVNGKESQNNGYAE